jgi:signal transduction histidine kinase
MSDIFFEILLIEDNPGDERLIRELLSETRYLRADITAAPTLRDALDLVSARRFDVILLDLNLPDSGGMGTVIQAHAAAPDIPILVLTGLDDDAMGAEAVRRGAQDYLVKRNLDPDALARLIFYAHERHKSKRDLMRSEFRLRRLIQSNADGMLVLDSRGEVLFANIAAEFLLGKSSDKLLNSRFPVPMSGERFAEIVVQDSNGQDAHIEMSVGVDFEWEGKSAVIVSLRDVSERISAMQERKRLEMQLQQAQKMEAIGMLAGGVAHDFNNMLTAINANAQLALRNQKSGKPVDMELKEILAAADRAADLTKKLLTFARKEKLNARPASLADIADSVANLLERTISKKIKITRSYAPDAPAVKADANQMHQAILNICTNACDAMPAGGELGVAIEIQTLDAEACARKGLRTPGEFVALHITDSGAGIAPQMLDKVFEPFFTTKGASKGTGLGLAVTLGIVQNHEGAIEVSSEQGRGTRFSMFLPASADAPDALAAQPRREDLLQTGSETILIVDDEVSVLESISRLLEALEYKVITASSGREGVQAFIDNMKSINLVLLDFMMPEMDGRDVYNAISKLRDDVPVLLCTGYSTDGAAGELLQRGVREVIAKPFNLPELSRAIRRALDSRPVPA